MMDIVHYLFQSSEPAVPGAAWKPAEVPSRVLVTTL